MRRYYAVQEAQVEEKAKALVAMPAVVHEFTSPVRRDKWVARGVWKGEAYRRAVTKAEALSGVGERAASPVRHIYGKPPALARKEAMGHEDENALLRNRDTSMKSRSQPAYERNHYEH